MDLIAIVKLKNGFERLIPIDSYTNNGKGLFVVLFKDKQRYTFNYN